MKAPMRMSQVFAIFFSLSTITFAQSVPASGGPFDVDSYCASMAKGIEHGDILTNACGFVLSLKQRLPNFTCDETMTRFYLDPIAGYMSRVPKQYDTVTMRVRYENSREQFSDIKRDGKEVRELSFLRGAWSEGEFGSFLRGVFSPESLTKFRFKKRAESGVTAVVYEYRVAQKNNRFWLLQVWGEKSAQSYPGIRGQVWLNEANGQLMRFEMDATDVDEAFPMQNVKNFVSYAEVPMGDGTKFVLPVSSTSTLCSLTVERRTSLPPSYDQSPNSGIQVGTSHGLCQENRMQFTNCHKFGVDTRILPVSEPSSAPVDK